MKQLLALALLLFVFAGPAFADHIGVYSDQTGTSTDVHCGFTSTVAIIEKFSVGSTASRFSLRVPAGSTVYWFVSPFFTIGSLTTDLSVAYDTCQSGSIVLGTVMATLTPGTLQVMPAFGLPDIIFTDCNFVEHTATGGTAFVANDCPLPVRPSTWGSVKALYR